VNPVLALAANIRSTLGVSSEAAREIVQRLRTNPTPDVIAAAADVIEALITMQNKLAEMNEKMCTAYTNLAKERAP